MKERIALVQLPEGFEPGTNCIPCGYCDVYSCEESKCPLYEAQTLQKVNGWSEICHAGQLYTVDESKAAEAKDTEGK